MAWASCRPEVVVILEDRDFDGTFERETKLNDPDQDGLFEERATMYRDTRGNLVSILELDTNGDGVYDEKTTLRIDPADGRIVKTFERDTEGDGTFDAQTLELDSDGDGVYEIIHTLP